MNLKGRPSGYRPEVHIPIVAFYAQEGLTVEQIVDRLGINKTTLYAWCNKYPELSNALKTTREQADSRVVESLYQKALKGDTIAMIFWLKNRQSAKWRDKQEIEQSGMVKVEHSGKVELSIEDVIVKYADATSGTVPTENRSGE